MSALHIQFDQSKFTGLQHPKSVLDISARFDNGVHHLGELFSGFSYITLILVPKAGILRALGVLAAKGTALRRVCCVAVKRKKVEASVARRLRAPPKALMP